MNQDPNPFSLKPEAKVTNQISSYCDKNDETCSFTYLPSAGTDMCFAANNTSLFNILSEKEQCGYPSNVPPSNIIGGKKTAPGRYSYTALLGYKKDKNEVYNNLEYYQIFFNFMNSRQSSFEYLSLKKKFQLS